ncbi:MaoC family dehydratase N-terminal domain-containing protein [Leucobacter albus]|uniref:MaoC family dehydratase N-terminal domain-containing protein n=1 Tax=Leucobacter albus TaxID=272210 RepID=A0ABW3TQH1_9MICO
MTEQHNTPDLSEWVGRFEVTRDVASRSAAIGLGAVLDRPLDPAAADTATLLPLGHWLQFTPTAPMSELGPDGHPQLGGFMPPLDLPRRMWAGSEVEFRAPIAVGQALERTTTIEAITPKHGSSGRLCFVVLRHEIAADGALAVVDRQTIVYREAVTQRGGSAAQPPRPDSPAPTGWEWARTHRPGETTLFRYSALTFNTHRIHYDHRYTTEVEGYPGLVVHGPLLATYIVDSFRDAHPGDTIAGFSFSARAPLFVGEQFHVVGRTLADGSEELAVINPDGGTSIAATITRA